MELHSDKLIPGKPVITNFKTKNLGDGHVIFITTIQELTKSDDNTGVLQAQRRALEAALAYIIQQLH